MRLVAAIDGREETTRYILGRQSTCFALSLFLALILCGCCHVSYSAETKKNDEAARGWLRRWSGEYDWTEIKSLVSVPDSKIPEAEILLRDRGSVHITQEQARELSGDSEFPPTARGEAYLLRAVGDGRSDQVKLSTFQRFAVFLRPNGDVWVSSGANSRCRVPMRRRAIVAWLQKPPNEAYATFVVGR